MGQRINNPLVSLEFPRAAKRSIARKCEGNGGDPGGRRGEYPRRPPYVLFAQKTTGGVERGHHRIDAGQPLSKLDFLASGDANFFGTRAARTPTGQNPNGAIRSPYVRLSAIPIPCGVICGNGALPKFALYIVQGLFRSFSCEKGLG